MNEENFLIKKLVLKRLFDRGKIGGSHIELNKLKKLLPLCLRSNKKGKKAIEKAFKELINEQFLLVKPSTGEKHVSINPKKIRKIKELLKAY